MIDARRSRSLAWLLLPSLLGCQDDLARRVAESQRIARLEQQGERRSEAPPATSAPLAVATEPAPPKSAKLSPSSPSPAPATQTFAFEGSAALAEPWVEYDSRGKASIQAGRLCLDPGGKARLALVPAAYRRVRFTITGSELANVFLAGQEHDLVKLGLFQDGIVQAQAKGKWADLEDWTSDGVYRVEVVLMFGTKSMKLRIGTKEFAELPMGFEANALDELRFVADRARLCIDDVAIEAPAD